ncbi:MAG TPA: alpha/beta fold hydrolase [Acidimicrobiia bacterium]|nr:alpha/beta fold hydrolase [Acidimicrobiia bacterium]
MRLVLVPGFTQTARSWDPVIAALRAEVEAVALDVPTGLSFTDTARALGDAGGRGTYAGYSAGGRLCLQLALDRPELVERLILVSASPGIADATERAARRAADEELAREIERDGIDAFLDRWLAQPLFATLPRDATGLDTRERDPSVLTHALRALGQGAQEPLWGRLPELRMPVVLVTGALDDKYTAIAREMAAPVANVRVHVIGGAGHALHLEQPDALADVLAS